MAKVSFTEHPASVGENYVEHLGSAWGFGAAMLRGSLACFIHGVFPFLCLTTGSRTIRDLHERMVTHRVRTPAGGAITPQG
ncbi:MAG: hypothetical protein ABS99_05320 [Acetobacteraceae bacterium SCN 69-10]|nr:hypothetical protein [Rhodospirillales bacterium]ODU56994.1 MAG: hypothetical protein ABS99_05320 [Acetobacteraceae bacterium SCN 69-10]OJY76873.1 MAG: hypothetical protein BGP12_05340 [Rhodospirillales bacterium 70-18]